jgi:hypothetical protein
MCRSLGGGSPTQWGARGAKPPCILSPYGSLSPGRRAAGAAAPPTPLARGIRPLEPRSDVISWMDAGRAWLSADACWIIGAMSRCGNRAASIKCRGSGGRPARPAGSARGGATSHGCTYLQPGEHEGRSHLAWMHLSLAREREGPRRPYAQSDDDAND